MDIFTLARCILALLMITKKNKITTIKQLHTWKTW